MKKKTDKKSPRVFETFPLAAEAYKETASKSTIPPLDNVKDAKEWVDLNEK